MVPMATARSVGNGVITMSPNSTYRRVVDPFYFATLGCASTPT